MTTQKIDNIEVWSQYIQQVILQLLNVGKNHLRFGGIVRNNDPLV